MCYNRNSSLEDLATRAAKAARTIRGKGASSTLSLPPQQEVMRYYWEVESTNKRVVEFGSKVKGSTFSNVFSDELGSSAWNLKVCFLFLLKLESAMYDSISFPFVADFSKISTRFASFPRSYHRGEHVFGSHSRQNIRSRHHCRKLEKNLETLGTPQIFCAHRGYAALHVCF